MFSRHHLNVSMIVNEQLDDWEHAKVPPRVEGSRSIKNCHLAIKKAAEGLNATKKHAGGRERIITTKVDRYSSLVAKRNKNATSNQIATDLAIATNTHNSAISISLLLNQVCLYAWKPV